MSTSSDALSFQTFFDEEDVFEESSEQRVLPSERDGLEQILQSWNEQHGNSSFHLKKYEKETTLQNQEYWFTTVSRELNNCFQDSSVKLSHIACIDLKINGDKLNDTRIQEFASSFAASSSLDDCANIAMERLLFNTPFLRRELENPNTTCFLDPLLPHLPKSFQN